MGSEGVGSEACESALKEQKLTDDEDVKSLSDEEEEDDEDYVSESDSESEDHIDPQIREEYRLYRRQFRETEGFGITIRLTRKIFGAIIPINLKESGYSELVKTCTDAAINDFNSKQNAKLHLETILVATVGLCQGYMFYITFEAKDSSSGETKTHQAKMYDGIERVPTIEVEIFRLKPEKQPPHMMRSP